MCDRFKCLPSQLLAEDSELLYLLDLEAQIGGESQ